MKHFTLKLFLLIACLCGATSMWAQTTTVGTTDNQTGWWSAFSDDYSIGADQTLSLSFVNHSDKAAVYHNWLLVLTTDAHRGDTGYEEYFVLRPDNLDNCGWGGAWNKTNLWSSYAGISDADFLNAMDGANVNLTITRSGANVSIQVEMTAVDGSKYNRTYGAVCGDGTQTIRAFLTVENAHITDLTASTAATVLPTTISSLPFYTGFNAGVNPFNAGTIGSNNSIGNVLNVSNSTATATWGNGTDPYVLANGEEVTVSFLAFHGWAGKLSSTVALFNDNNEELVSYTYTQSTNVTDVKIGGNKVNDADFSGQAKQANGTNGANGLENRPFVFGANVSMIVRQNGSVTFNFVHEKAGVNKTFTANVGEKASTIKYMKITDAVGTNPSERSISIDNLNITSVISTTPQHSYSIIWKDQSDNSTIKEEIGLLGDENSTPAISQESFIYNGKKYNYVSDNAAPLTADDTEIIVVCKEADKYTYTVNATDGENVLATISTGEVYKGESAKVYYPQFYLDGTTLRQIANNSGEYYGTTVTPDADNYVKELAYVKSAIENVVFYVEGENIEGASKATNLNRASNGYMGFATEDLTLTTLEPGIYKIYVRGVNGNSAARSFSFKNGDNELFADAIPNGTNYLKNSDEITITETTQITFSCAGSSASGMDWIYIQRTGNIATTDISSVEYRTYVTPFDVDFSKTEGLTAYVVESASRGESGIQYTEVTAIPAKTPVILHGAEGTYNIYESAYTGETITNELKTGPVTVSDDNYGTIFVLNTGANGVGFYLLNNGKTLSEGKCYLEIPKNGTDDGAKFIGFHVGDATAIDSVRQRDNNDAAIYNMAGQRVMVPTKGLYIVNGKKVFIK